MRNEGNFISASKAESSPEKSLMAPNTWIEFIRSMERFREQEHAFDLEDLRWMCLFAATIGSPLRVLLWYRYSYVRHKMQIMSKKPPIEFNKFFIRLDFYYSIDI